MKAAENLVIDRTDGNTDPMIVRLRRQTDDSGIVDVGDSAAVRMDVDEPGGNLPIDGTAKGGGQGYFLFPSLTLEPGRHTRKIGVNVAESGVDVTYGRGKIVTAEKRGA